MNGIGGIKLSTKNVTNCLDLSTKSTESFYAIGHAMPLGLRSGANKDSVIS